jgi:hypothetical protein
MKRREFLGALASAPLWSAEAMDWRGLEHTLRLYATDDGRVKYGALKQDLGPLSATVEQLASFVPAGKPALAHWINTYNSLILWSFAKSYPAEKNRLKNPLRRAAYFYKTKFRVAGRDRSLADIEDNSIRSAGDPRIHFAIVCASASCPWLSRELYTEANLERKLEEEARRFVGQSRNVSLDKVRRTATVSEIFKWFRKDFGGSEETVLRYLAKRLPGQNIDPPNWKLRYFDYDWSLNELL